MKAISRASALMAAAGLMVSVAHAQNAAGDWHGALKVGASELRLGLTITAGPEGAMTGQLISPDQGGPPIPISEVRGGDGKLSFTAPAVRGRFDGIWDAARQAWVGSWSQGATLPLTLTRGPVAIRARPQTPAKPYPYREEEVVFDSAPGVRLAGTLTLPIGKGPFPAVALITGSGAQDRNETLAGHQPFLVLADHLTRRGVAVLRSDDRGVGRSTGNFATATSSDFAIDAEAAASYLRGRPDIAAGAVGLLGHSEGGMIAPMVAAKDPKVAFIVLLAAPAAPTRELMKAQRQAVMTVMGASPEVIARAQTLMTKIDDAVLQAKSPAAARTEVARLLSEAGGNLPPVAGAMQASMIGTAWYREFIAYDPRPNLAKIRVPVLALNGDKDLQVIASQNLPALKAALRDNRDVTIVELPSLNHLFQTAATGSPQEYGRLEETISPTVLDTIASWIVARTIP
jgi:uncharacterized protein